ncbi:hypothetical protein Bca4012_084872 [Brassica carinata]|uniref:Uncharacterized protein n=1 Tax=Brassica carinata TaxID=52824 RepID=A0A8X7V8J0_BRACI|nr:hypothetical protein Bca52824_025795 [Brassica carinata]
MQVPENLHRQVRHRQTKISHQSGQTLTPRWLTSRVRQRQRRPLTMTTNVVIDEPPESRNSHREPPHQSSHRYTEIERNATNNT